MKRLLIGALLLLVPRVATGATFVVNSTVDAVDAVPGDGVCAAAGGDCTLRAAVEEANALAGAHVITLPAGTYVLTIDVLSVALSKNITIDGAGQATTFVDGNGQHGVFAVSGGSLTLSGLTVQHGLNSDGGGILVTGVVGVYPNDYPGALTLSDMTITHNVSRSIANDSSSPGTGGGVSIHSGGSATMNRVAITGNRGDSGGGIHYDAYPCGTVASSLSVTDSTIAQNVAATADGLSGEGGALVLFWSCSDVVNTSVVRSTISGNSAVQAGGILVGLLANAGFWDTTISGNTATRGSGGAIMVDPSVSFATAHLYNVTIASNSSATGGAVEVRSTWRGYGYALLSVANTIIANSTGAAPANCTGVPISDAGNNIEFPGTSCGFSAPSDRRADPLLLPLAFNGGLTQTHALAFGSPAINAGNDGMCRAVDQRGAPRPAAAHCDIGSYEAQGAPTAVTGVATGIANGATTLNGTVNPNWTATNVFFQYGLTTAYGAATPVQGLAAGSSAAAMGGSIADPVCGALHHFRVVATNMYGTTNGADATFTAAACPPPTVTTGAAGPIHETGANIQGTVNPNGALTTITVEYGPTTSYGATSLPLSVPAGTSVLPIARLVNGLQCHTLYHYRVKAANASVSAVGIDATFTSALCALQTPTLLWRNLVTGQNVAWLFNGEVPTDLVLLPTVADLQWSIQATGDIDGDGNEDIVWRHSGTGQVTAWFVNASHLENPLSSALFLPTVADPNWVINGLRDFDGDGKADLLWHNTVTGKTVIWFLNGTGVISWAYAPTVADVNWEIVRAADFNGDGKADLLWRNKATGDQVIWIMDHAGLSNWEYLPPVVDPTWALAAVGDLDGDGRADIVWRNSVSGKNVVWFMNGTSIDRWAYLTTVGDPNWFIARVADFDGDGASDLVWRYPANSAPVLWQMNADQIVISRYILGSFVNIYDPNWSLISR
jgi:CSLREA domain-containing protein